MRNSPWRNFRIGRVAESERACNQRGLISGCPAGFPLGFTDGEESPLGDIRRCWVGGHGWRRGKEFEPQWAVFGVRPVRPTFNHGVFDLAGEHNDDVDILFPNKTRVNKQSALIILLTGCGNARPEIDIRRRQRSLGRNVPLAGAQRLNIRGIHVVVHWRRFSPRITHCP